MEQFQNINLENISNITPEKFNKICRLCLCESEIKPFFKLHFEGLLLFEIYQEITSLQIRQGDNLPEHICMTCIEKIVCTFLFIRKCQQLDKMLRNITEDSKTNSQILLKKDLSQAQYNMHAEKEEVVKIAEEQQKEHDEDAGDIRIKEEWLEENHSCENSFVIAHQNKSDSMITNCVLNSSKLKHDSREVKYSKVKNNSTVNKFNNIGKQLPQLSGPPFICEVCNESYNTLAEFKWHYKKSSKCKPRIHSCNLCNKRFISGYKLRVHMRSHTTEKPFECDVCNEKFRYDSNLARHKRIHTGAKPFACKVCGKTYTRSTSLIEHERAHTGEFPFMCTYCGKRFQRLGYFKLHTMKHRIGNGKDIKSKKKISEKLKCSKCFKKYVTKQKLLIHEQSHLEEIDKVKKHLCSVCGKTYASKMILAVHARVHSNKMSYFCSSCDKSFSYKSSLDKHMFIHTGERRYKCTLCDKTFVQSIHLRQHIRTHTGEKPYMCDFCGKSFALKCNMVVHRRQHTGETPYYCPVCNRGFPDSSSMKKHRRTHGEIKIE